MDINRTLTIKSSTMSPVEQVLKRLCGDFSKQVYCTFTYASARIGIPLDARTTSSPPHQSTEQLPAGFRYLSVIGNSSTKELKLYNLLKYLLVIVYWLFILCAVYRLLRFLIEFAFGSRFLEVCASFSCKTTEGIN